MSSDEIKALKALHGHVPGIPETPPVTLQNVIDRLVWLEHLFCVHSYDYNDLVALVRELQQKKRSYSSRVIRSNSPSDKQISLIRGLAQHFKMAYSRIAELVKVTEAQVGHWCSTKATIKHPIVAATYEDCLEYLLDAQTWSAIDAS